MSEDVTEEAVEVVVSVGLALGRGKERSDVATSAGEAIAKLYVADRRGGVYGIAIVEGEDDGERTMYLAPRVWL